MRPKDRWPNAGRIVTGEAGSVLRIIERADLANAESSNASFTVRGEARAAKDIEATAETVNQAVYLFRASALFGALDALSTGNVQKEEYLTDTIAHVVENGGRVVSVPVDHPDDVLAFNNPEELLEIEESLVWTNIEGRTYGTSRVSLVSYLDYVPKEPCGADTPAH